ncbi:hypothetical protein GF354_00740 [Candidatus Peregrinibacteria bacterium]|nr:hypothetical protein [Candidatus Peregrinibacteria bacterium]
METIQNIKKVSLVFFIVSGLIHLSSAMLLANEIAVKYAFIVNKIMDIPFIITGMVYGLSSIRLKLFDPEKDHKIVDTAFLVVTILTMVGLLTINLVLPSINS